MITGGKPPTALLLVGIAGHLRAVEALVKGLTAPTTGLFGAGIARVSRVRSTVRRLDRITLCKAEMPVIAELTTSRARKRISLWIWQRTAWKCLGGTFRMARFLSLRQRSTLLPRFKRQPDSKNSARTSACLHG